MPKRLVLNSEGQSTYCTTLEENTGKGRCNYIAHQGTNETVEDPDVRAKVAKQGYRSDKPVNDEERASRIVTEKQVLDKLMNNIDYTIRMAAAEQDYDLDKLINDKNWNVRVVIAEQGYRLDKFIDDKDWLVREAVANHGYGLDKLVNDKEPAVRAAVARQGYGLNKLVNDESWTVRREVAEQGYGLDQLVNDKHPLVRVAVAGKGYGLDKLVNDSDFEVCEEVEEYLNNNHITIQEYTQKVEETGGYDWVKDLKQIKFN